MRKVVFGTGLLLLIAVTFAFAQSPTAQVEKKVPTTGTIEWMSWEEAMEANAHNPKKIFVDIYTDWCGWCKHMDRTTFIDAEVVEYMNENFYAVKLNAEAPGDKIYQGQNMTFRQNAGRNGIHELAITLLNGRVGYPSFVFLDEEQNSLKISPGFKTPDVLMAEMKQVASE